MTRCDPRVARSKAAILQAAAGLLGDEGLAGTSVEAIAARAGVAKTTIYRHWPDRAALLLDAVSGLGDAYRAEDTADLRHDLVVSLREIEQRITRSPFSRVLPALIDAAERDPAMAAAFEAHGQARRRHLLARLSKAVAAGELPADTDVTLLHALLVGPLFYQRLLGHKAMKRSDIEALVDLVLAGAGAHQRPAVREGAG